MITRVAIWLAIGRTIGAISILILPIILVRALSQTDYGVFKQVDLAAGLLVPFLGLGFGKSITYFVPRSGSKVIDEVSTSLVAILGVSLIPLLLGLLSPSIFSKIFGIEDVRLLVLAIVMLAISTNLLNVAVRCLVTVGSARAAGLIPLAIGVPRTTALILVAIFLPSLTVILTVYIFFASVEIVTILTILRRRGYFTFTFDLRILQKHLSYGGFLAALSIGQNWATRIDRYLVSSSLSLEVFAVYAVGRASVPFTTMLSQVVTSATAPRYSLLESEARYQDMATLWRKATEALLPLNLLVASCLFSVAHWLIPIVFTDSYAAAVPIFQIFSFSLVLRCFDGYEMILRALAAFRFITWTFLFSLSLKILLSIAALQSGSLALLAGVQLLIDSALVFFSLLYIHRRLMVPWSTLVPRHGLMLTGFLAGIGILTTLLIGTYIPEQPLLALVGSAFFWGLLIAIGVWRQGLWRKVLPALKNR